ncbi:transglutaminase domain-containing protein [Hwangdonia lutea]|uniref:Transglutaminase domain-containing protein n=1 Tax=Hwangdonia lutea TaxID=3075823 RepID=A0AA97ELT3_9FLAO|nr:transglutaminase domain-containing protein [Hwangdonia sp. SCSIO 19198]WOD43854.1 transglutaminase domain-containing protein [Hwangdonia sp. SCSIO 19198]
MKKRIFLAFVIFSAINYGFSQNESIKELVEKTNGMNLGMLELTDFAKEHLKDKQELARFFYYWTSTNIEYDHKSLNEKKEGIISLKEYSIRQEEYKVYKNRKGVCAGYSNLFKWFMDAVDIEAVIISGHIRDERNHYVELTKDDNFRHAWNAIKLNGKWTLIDTTWGTSNESTTSEFYFDIKPEWSIITHFPEDSKWQLLKRPLSLEEFNNSQFVKPIWFKVGFTEIPKLMADHEYYYFKYQNIPNNKWLIGLQFSTDNIDFKAISDIKVIEEGGFTYFRFGKAQIPETTFFKVKIAKFENLNDGFSKVEYDDVINFKI